MQKKRSLRIRRLLSFMLALMIALALTPVSSTLAYLPSDLYRMQVGVHADHILTIPPYVTPDDGEIYGWSVIWGGSLPAGMTITPASGSSGTVYRLTGTPTIAGSGTVYIGFTQIDGLIEPEQSGLMYGFDYIVDPHECWLHFLYDDYPSALPGGTVGSAYSVQIKAESCGSPIVFEDGGGVDLLPGLTLNANGILSGTPTEAGTFSFMINAGVSSREHNTSSEHQFTITIDKVNVVTGTLIALKKNENGVPLAGAVLRMEGVTDTGDRRLYESETDRDGVARFTVEYGIYTLYEHTAPAGYNISDATYEIMVSPNGVFDITDPYESFSYNPVTFIDKEIPILNKNDHFAYMVGYPDGTFGAVRNMTRAEAVVMFSRLLAKSMALTSTDNGSLYYTDIGSDTWYAAQVGYMHRLGVLTDYAAPGKFRPDEPVTRAEFATLAAHFDNLTLTSSNKFTDVANDHWAVKYINSAAAKGWIVGYADNTFKPEAYITRAEVVTLVNRILERYADEAYVLANIKTLPRSYTDVGVDNWAFFTIMEASTGHDFLKEGAKEKWTAVYQ